MRILITGGAGFLGAGAAEHLLEQGATVTVLDNFATGRRDALSEHVRLTTMEGSVAEPTTVEQAFAAARPTHVLHAAAAYRDPDAWDEDVRTNVLGTALVARASKKHAVQRLVYTQTALCYGPAQERPITLRHPVAPITSYAISKTAGEQYLMMSGLSYVSLRLANIYGPRHYSGPMPAFYRRLKAGEPCTIVRTRRDFIELTDFLRLLDAALQLDGPCGCFNVSSGYDCTIEEIYERISKILQVQPAAAPTVVDPGEDDTSSLLLDPFETNVAFDWRAEVPLDQGLRRLVAWYEANGVGETHTHLRIAGEASR